MTTDTELVQNSATKAWVLVIDHKHGANVTAHPSRAALDAELFQYCDTSWDTEFTEPRPAYDELVARYWEKMSEGGEEWHLIEECEIDGGAGKPAVSIKPMRLSDGRADYFVSIKVGDREVTPHVFREEYKAAYHVALYDWLLNGSGEEPDAVAFAPDDWPARVPPAASFADAYEAARQTLPRDLMLEVVSRNATGDGTEKLCRPDNEPDDEFARRIIATYLAVTSGPRKAN